MTFAHRVSEIEPRWSPLMWREWVRGPGLRVGLAGLAVACHGSVVWAQEDLPDLDVAPRGFLQIVFAGGPLGVAIMLVLFALSLTATYLVIEHLLTIRRQHLVPEPLQQELASNFEQGNFAAAEAACQAQPSLLSFVILQGLMELEGGWTAVEKSLEDALADQAARLLRKIEYLSVIGNLAPMVGLLGTVVGMVLAFQQVAVSQGTAGAGELAEGIYQALVTTVGGLMIAIPALGAYAVLRNRIDQLLAESTYVVQHVCRPLRRRLQAGPPRGIVELRPGLGKSS